MFNEVGRGPEGEFVPVSEKAPVAVGIEDNRIAEMSPDQLAAFNAQKAEASKEAAFQREIEQAAREVRADEVKQKIEDEFFGDAKAV